MIPLAICKRLKQAVADSDTAEILGCLAKLAAREPNVEVMKASNIGKVIRRLTKHSNTDVAAQSKVRVMLQDDACADGLQELMQSWKKIILAPPKPSQKVKQGGKLFKVTTRRCNCCFLLTCFLAQAIISTAPRPSVQAME